MKKVILTIVGLVATFTLVACNSTQTTTTTTSKASTIAPSSSVAEVKDDYVAIGGKTPYEQLTATEEQAIKKAEEEARLQAEAKAKAQAEAKAKADAEAKKQAEQAQAQANQTAEVQNTEQTGGVQQAQPAQQAQQTAEQPAQTASTGHDYTTPAPAGQHWYTFPNGQRVLVANSAYLAHKAGYDYCKSIGDELGMRQAQAMMEDDLANGRY